MELILDTETTGLTRLSFANKFNFKQWPRLVEIAWAVIDGGSIHTQKSFIIQPDGFQIPPTTTQIHGISQSKAEAEGHPIQEVLNQLNTDLKNCTSVIAHNLSFDLGVIESESLRQEQPLKIPDKRVCTLHAGRQYLTKTKGLKRGGYPKLGQLYETLFGFPFSNPHNADNDVTACFHIYKRLKQLGFI